MREEMQKKKGNELDTSNSNSEENTSRNDYEHLNDTSSNTSGKY